MYSKDKHPFYFASFLSRFTRWFVFVLLLTVGLGACTSVSTISPAIRPTRISHNAPPPTIDTSPSSGYAGVYVQVKGRDWPSNSLVLLVLEDQAGRSGILTAANADGTGHFETGFLYPSNQRWLSPGDYTVLAYVGNGSRQTTASFTVTMAETATPIPPPTIESVATETATTTPAAQDEPITATVATPTITPLPLITEFQDWRGEYWGNPYLDGTPVLVRDDPAIVFDWGFNSPADFIPSDYFSARWSRPLYFEEGVYRFFLEVDDGARLYIDNAPIINDWREGSQRTVFVDFNLSAGVHFVQIDYFEQTERAVIRFWWERQ